MVILRAVLGHDVVFGLRCSSFCRLNLRGRAGQISRSMTLPVVGLGLRAVGGRDAGHVGNIWRAQITAPRRYLAGA